MALDRTGLEILEREGYLVVPNALDAAWIRRLLRAFADAPAQQDGTQHVPLTETTPERGSWQALESHPLVVAAGAQILARPFRLDVHGRNPLPGYGQQGLHADWTPRAPPDPYFVMTTIWMLDDFTLDHGATRLVPRSHRITRPLPKSLAQPLARHPEETIVIGCAGSVLIMNGHLWHSGRRNDSRRPRRAVQMVAVAGTS